MKARTVFVGFLSVPDGRHDAFLDWHELEHRPENHGGIDHIFHSERFIAEPGMLAARHVTGSGPLADPGQYLMTYWSTAEPDQVTHDMAVLREQLAAQGRCHPINRNDPPVRDAVAAAYSSGPADRPELLFQGSYVAQHAAQPRYYT
jgi:hypothetical protein